MRKIYSPHHGLYLPIGGRLVPKARPKLRFADYIKDSASNILPKAPDAVDYSVAAPGALEKVYLNDKLGCCVVAALCHARGVTSGNASGDPHGGGAVVFSNDDIEKMYTLFSGGVFNPADPANTDQGCDESQALSLAQSVGFTDGVKLSGCIGVDGTNWEEVKLATYLFECLMSGQGLPEPWVTPFPSPGAVWDVDGPAVPTNGHAVAYPGYTADGKLITVTWGFKMFETKAAIAAYATPAGGGELWAFLSPDIVARATGKAPTGFDFEQLQADLAALPTA